MMGDNPIIEKIKKLLALSNSCNEHEAALAASHVQRLLSEHNLAMADIETSPKPEKADKVETAVAKTMPKWLRHLCSGVSDAFDCQAIHNPATGTMTFIGVGTDVQIAAYTFTYLDKTIRRLCAAYMKQQASTAISTRHRELIRHSYYLGAVSTINQRLTSQKKETPVTPGALIPVKKGLIKRAISEIGRIRTVDSRRSYINSGAYSQGQTDGKQVGIHRGVENGTAAQGTIAR
jgi:hypothetical protein